MPVVSSIAGTAQHHPAAPPAAQLAASAPSEAARDRGDLADTETLRRRAETSERAAIEARVDAADAAARHERALSEERQRSAATLAAAEDALQKQVAELVAQHQADLEAESKRSAAAVEAAAAPLHERIAADAAAHDNAMRAEREKAAEAVEAATAPLRHRVEALHEASARAAALVRTLQQQQSAPASHAELPLLHTYETHAPLWVVSKVADFCRRVYDAALGLTREQRLAAGMVGCLASQLLLIWLIRRYMELPSEVQALPLFCEPSAAPVHTAKAYPVCQERSCRADAGLIAGAGGSDRGAPRRYRRSHCGRRAARVRQL